MRSFVVGGKAANRFQPISLRPALDDAPALIDTVTNGEPALRFDQQRLLVLSKP